jgi:hypothetical protein
VTPSTYDECIKGYWESTSFLKEVGSSNEEITFYDSVSGKPLFIAPRGRTFEEFKKESMSHGWPSFRDEEVGCYLYVMLCYAILFDAHMIV